MRFPQPSRRELVAATRMHDMVDNEGMMVASHGDGPVLSAHSFVATFESEVRVVPRGRVAPTAARTGLISGAITRAANRIPLALYGRPIHLLTFHDGFAGYPERRVHRPSRARVLQRCAVYKEIDLQS
jgi:hypothetical protein